MFRIQLATATHIYTLFSTFYSFLVCLVFSSLMYERKKCFTLITAIKVFDKFKLRATVLSTLCTLLFLCRDCPESECVPVLVCYNYVSLLSDTVFVWQGAYYKSIGVNGINIYSAQLDLLRLLGRIIGKTQHYCSTSCRGCKS